MKNEGNISIKKTNYSWGTLRVIEVGHSFSVILHPEHWEKVLAFVAGDLGDSFKFTDETRRQWTVEKYTCGIVFKSEGTGVFINGSRFEELE